MYLTDTHTLAAYLYLHLAETMPDELPEDATREEIEAQNRWFLEPETVSIDMEEVERFITSTENLISSLEDAGDGLQEDEYQTLFYDAAKAAYDGDRSMIRTYFMWLYLVMYGYPHGFRWGPMVYTMGVEAFCDRMRSRFMELI